MDNKNTKKTRTEKVFINYNIKCSRVRVILDNGQTMLMDIDDAITLAKSQDKDLVQISYDKNSKLAVCKIINYGKFKYEQTKKEKNIKRQAKINECETKTIQFSIMTDDNDKNRLISHAINFLKDRNKVKITIRFRNRHESQNIEYAKSVMNNILTNFTSIADVDSPPALSGREFSCILKPQNKGL